ncbi:hypothetical protein KTT_37850 [Tengunoibacter tsumagoiensis]|uniref:FHA domain-containing protein n=2 Tax=Tengunoibacter tsumagoiensis TaxID=2014871 RepID=A0A402A4E7_9CHLR|nr:hypothetical protein KTT_37850 [Tengunoibacter tsumagoiensis]
MDKCPYCGAETRPGDNFCLNCGNRLQAPTPSQQSGSEATLATAPEDWAAAQSPIGTGGWSDPSAPTIAASSGADLPTVRETVAPTAQATLDRIEQPAHFILRSDTGEVLQEYPLDKDEITIGRAPNSDILLSKDKLTSRRHATVRFENNRYMLYDEHSANGTFVNAQQIDDTTPYELVDGDHVGIGEHELVFRTHAAAAGQDMPTIPVPQEPTFRTREDPLLTVPTSNHEDEFGTVSHEEQPEVVKAYTPLTDYPPVAAPEPKVEPTVSAPAEQPVVETSTPPPAPVAEKTALGTANGARPAGTDKVDGAINFNRFNSIASPSLPDASALVAALAALDGQVKDLQDQMNATQDAMRSHESEISQTANQLRSGIRRVSDRMDSTIADVARSREALAWAELLQLMEDVMNNPRDIEYVTKLARKARELNKVFQIHQNVLNTMAECNSLLRGMIGEEK